MVIAFPEGMLDLHTTVARAVLDHSECAAVFQRHRIDYCCKGSRSIAAAAEERGIDQAVLMTELRRAIAERRDDQDVDPGLLPTPSLIAYIIGKHHDYLRKALPFVHGLGAKVARVHGEREPRLVELATVVAELCDALMPHLDMEEQVLFPALMARSPHPALVATELGAMHDDHLAVGALLSRLRDVTDDFRLPAEACTSYRTLFGELEVLEGDILRHVHLENHVLMPRFAGK
jgi:regulator of cell morphogenesis and NO signaling